MRPVSKMLGVGCLFAALFSAGCGSLSGWETQTAPDDFTKGTRVLAEVVLVTTREQVLANQGLMTGWRDKLLAAGYSDADIVDGSEVTLWTYCYGWNSGVPVCSHHGHYVAHVPVELRGTLEDDPDSRTETTGDLVEVELSKTNTGYLVGKVISVYRKSGNWGPCRNTSLSPPSQIGAAVSSVAGIGPARAIWIECTDVETDGWMRHPVHGAPPSAGPPISEWVKVSP